MDPSAQGSGVGMKELSRQLVKADLDDPKLPERRRLSDLLLHLADLVLQRRQVLLLICFGGSFEHVGKYTTGFALDSEIGQGRVDDESGIVAQERFGKVTSLV